MIVAETADRYRFITQPAHADVAGQLASRWGNDAFDTPAPHAPVMIAAYDHDDGWWPYDRRPHLDDDGTPVDFREVPAETWISLYDRGIEGVVDLSPYAGLLVSMHGTGLRRRRYGLSPSWPPVQPAFEAFADREEARQRRLAADLEAAAGDPSPDTALLAELHESGTPPEETASPLWFHYRLLQAWDTLSLAVCTTASPPAFESVDDVPRAPDGPGTTLSLEVAGDDAVRVEPYPFDESPVVVSVSARSVRKDAFETAEDLLFAYYESPPGSLSISFRPADE